MKEKKRIIDLHFHLVSYVTFVLAAAIFIVPMTSLLSGCAPTSKPGGVQDEAVRTEARMQKEAAFATAMKRHDHVYTIAFPLLAEASALNPDEAEPTCGFLIHSLESYRENFREAAVRYWNLDKQIAVRYVAPQFPAASCGLCAGDRITSINGKPVAGATLEDLKKTVAEMKPVEGKPLELAVNRNGEVIQMNIEGKSYCPYPVFLFTSDKINAFSDGKNILLTTGMYRMAQTDEELAVILSHEIAHNLMKHRKQLAEKAAPGTVLDVIVSVALGVSTNGTFGNMVAASYSKDFEREADYVGLYLTARAGYDISDAANLWRRMAIEHPSTIENSYSSSHPSNPERFIAIEKAVKEINEKKQLGVPLVPNIKPKKFPKSPPSQQTEWPADERSR